MQVQIKGELQELPLQTITLQPEDGINIYSFHCPNCGNYSKQIGGKVSKIYPFYEPNDQVVVVDRCRSCGRKYNFQTHSGYSSEKVKIILHPFEEQNYFYCTTQGKSKILEYAKNYIYSFVENKIKTAPFFSTCAESMCKTVYYFSDLI